MASYIEINDLGSFANIEALWAAHPEGGHEGDYCTIGGVKYHWDKYDRMWVAPPNFGPTRPRQVTTFNGDVNIQNNLTVAGTIRAKGINNPCVGFFPSEEALEEKWPYPKVGWWAIVGDTIPGEIYHCVTEGEWTDSGETGGSGEVDLTEYAKLTDIPEIADDLVTNDSNKVLSARQGKILNEKIPPVVDNLTSTSATSSLSAKQGKVLNEKIPAVVDNLTTSSPISALSAKQGKILKTLIDNIGSINVEGIQGFWPIDSLDDLPENPTEEQKKLAYLYENALYIYVGAGGDTLDGKYKSTQLVTLDWNDKAYAPSIYNGLGRTTLKKNMVEGVNVLTSAMIGTDNTEYFIQYDYDLDGATITLPANASLVFMGGSIKNGTLIGNNTRIQAKKGVCIFDDITIQGTWDVAEAYSSWFKMHKKGYKIKSVTEAAVTLYKGTDNNYYNFEDLTLVGSDYYVTSTLEGGEVVESSIKATASTYATFRIEGYNADSTIDYVAAPAGVPGAFVADEYSQYDDTAALQSLLDIRAKSTIIEDGIYMINAEAYRNGSTSDAVYTGLFYENQCDAELVIEGCLKVLPNDKGDGYHDYHAFQVRKCQNIHIFGKGVIQGDLLEHKKTSGEYGHNIGISNTKNLTVEGITSAFAWGDCIYNSWDNVGAREGQRDNSLQGFHSYKNVSIIYGGRTGLVYELGNNVVVDGCYFYGSGRVRGKSTYSAVDIEPSNYSEVSIRYVKNYEFKNNVFDNSYNGLRLERCLMCSVHDNIFDYGDTGIKIVSHTDASSGYGTYDERSWSKSRMGIYNNTIKNCSVAVRIGDITSESTDCDNVEAYSNLIISCKVPFRNESRILTNCHIHHNTTYQCGTWRFNKLIDCEINNNRNYAVNLPDFDNNSYKWGNGRGVIVGNIADCKNSSFHDNIFTLDYGKVYYGFGRDGKSTKYGRIPVGAAHYAFGYVSLNYPENLHIYNNKVSDDFYLYFGSATVFTGGLNTIRTENSEVFLVGDTFKSATYGDEGVVTSGAILSCSWLEDVREFSDMVENDDLDVEYGEVIKLDETYYKLCNKSGTCDTTLVYNQGDCGTARFLTSSIYVTTGGTLKIRFTTRGACTSLTRPDTFLFIGRRMWETDTNREIVYNGSDWVYNDIYTET